MGSPSDDIVGQEDCGTVLPADDTWVAAGSLGNVAVAAAEAVAAAPGELDICIIVHKNCDTT